MSTVICKEWVSWSPHARVNQYQPLTLPITSVYTYRRCNPHVNQSQPTWPWTSIHLDVKFIYGPPQEGVVRLYEHSPKEQNDKQNGLWALKAEAMPTTRNVYKEVWIGHGLWWHQACLIDQNVFKRWHDLGNSNHAQNVNSRGKVGTHKDFGTLETIEQGL